MSGNETSYVRIVNFQDRNFCIITLFMQLRNIFGLLSSVPEEILNKSRFLLKGLHCGK